MKLTAIAVDYDGTIAERGRPDPSVIDAVQEARSRGTIVVLSRSRLIYKERGGRATSEGR
jgi:hydroxymethylpyrimidine pyrophosphatase-like HAD family hydrolase